MKPSSKKIIEKISDSLIQAVGTPISVLIHTIFFAGIFMLTFFGWTIDKVLLLLTTLLSIEAIYLALFIQMTINKTNESIEDVEKDIDSIQAEEIEDEIHDESVSNTLSSIQKQLTRLQTEIESLKNKSSIHNN